MNTQLNPYRRSVMKTALAGWLSESCFSHAITLNPNRGDIPMREQERLFSSFCMEIDRLKHGRRRVHQLPSAERFHAIALPEKPLSNAHLHLAANLHFVSALGMTEVELGQAVDSIWTQLTKGSGSVDVQQIRGQGWANYITKEALRADHTYLIAATYHAA